MSFYCFFHSLGVMPVICLKMRKKEQIRKALSIVEKSAMTEGQLYVYERFWDQVNREHVLAEGNFNDGLAIGEAKGRAEGRGDRSTLTLSKRQVAIL